MEVFFFSLAKSLHMRLLVVLFFYSSIVLAQHTIVLDSASREPIPLVSIYDGTRGVITNSNGIFYWDKPQTDSITFSCLGYADKKVATAQIKDTLYMLPKAVELLPVMVSNRTLSAKEIIDSVKINTNGNIDFGLSSSNVYIHSAYEADTYKMDFKIKKSSVPEINQNFIADILNQIPRKETNQSFSKSKWLRDNGGLKHHKLQVLQAAKLIDSFVQNHFESMEKTVEEIFNKRVKKDSYFKVKSGPLISVEMENPTIEVDSMEQVKRKLTPKKYAANTLGILQRLANKNLFVDKNWALPFLANPNKYRFENEGIVYKLSVPAYKIRFSSKKKKDYNGYLLVDVEDFGVHEIVYQSNTHLNRLKLFGLHYERKLKEKSYAFVKNHMGKYILYQIYEEYQQHIGIKRPIKIIEKNNVLKGRNRQNILAMDVNLRRTESLKKRIYFNAFTPISKQRFDAFILKHHVLPKDLYSTDDVKTHIPGLYLE